MNVTTLEGVVEHGQIRLKGNVHLPENTKVFVIVPKLGIGEGARVYSPRLVRPEQADDFKMEVTSVATSSTRYRCCLMARI